jgi:hypothetical protein
MKNKWCGPCQTLRGLFPAHDQRRRAPAKEPTEQHELAQEWHAGEARRGEVAGFISLTGLSAASIHGPPRALGRRFTRLFAVTRSALWAQVDLLADRVTKKQVFMCLV